MPEADDILFGREGGVATVTLNRPQALNAFTLGMYRRFDPMLRGWADDPEVHAVLIRGAGGRAFCAGGDIRLLYEQGKVGDHDAQLAFWREEYILNHRIKRYAKPYISLIDGLVMGGGVGLSAHGAHVVASERYVFAMPEVGIGFFPDVGATYLLPRLSHCVGRYFALTGERADVGDALAFGLADAFVDGARIGELARALESEDPISTILAAFKTLPPGARLFGERAAIERWFGGETVGECLAALAKAAEDGAVLAKTAHAAMLAKSPTSEAIALRQVQAGASLSFEEALKVEFRIVSRICRGADFYEGVRALIVDKDNNPRWRPASHQDVTAQSIDVYFAPLGAEELVLDRRPA
jgi:enoyl-CoA hydratase